LRFMISLSRFIPRNPMNILNKLFVVYILNKLHLCLAFRIV
jgi:hypothetical protein